MRLNYRFVLPRALITRVIMYSNTIQRLYDETC